jgi:hypothetical protein
MRPDLNSTLASAAGAGQGMRRPRSRLLGICLGLAIALTTLFAAPAAHASDRIYWSNFENDSIAWADLNDDGGGGIVNTTGATVDGPMGLTLDPAHGRVYWANWASHMGTTISYANLDGSGGGDLAITGATIAGPHGLAIDPGDGPYGTLYWPNHDMDGISSIGWAQLDETGTSGEGDDLATGTATLDEPRGMMIDPASKRVYWANFADGFGKTVSYANLDDSGGADLIDDIGAFPGAPGPPAEPRGPEGTAIDPATGKIYWSDFGQKHLIQYAKPDGTGISALDTTGAGAHGVHGVAIDPGTDRIYWANWFSNGIGWAKLDGSGGGDLDVTGANTADVDHPVDHPNLPSLLKTPKATDPPVIGGGAAPGSTLTCTPGGWAGDVIEALAYRAPESLAYQWSRNGNDLSGAAAKTSSITADSDGNYRCRVTATNAAGGTSQTSSGHTIDGTPPETTIDSGPSGKTTDNDPTFTFSSEGGATFQCRLDGPGAVTGAFASCTSPKHYTDLADGDYTFRVRASDEASNTGTPATRSFTVDTTPPPVTPPKTTITKQPKSKIKTKKKSVRVRVSFRSKTGATFRCKLDKAGYKGCSSPYRVKVKAKRKRHGVKPKQHRISVKAIDGAGNVGKPASVKFKVIRKR